MIVDEAVEGLRTLAKKSRSDYLKKDINEFFAKTLGKDRGFTTRSDVGLPPGSSIKVTVGGK